MAKSGEVTVSLPGSPLGGSGPVYSGSGPIYSGPGGVYLCPGSTEGGGPGVSGTDFR